MRGVGARGRSVGKALQVCDTAAGTGRRWPVECRRRREVVGDAERAVVYAGSRRRGPEFADTFLQEWRSERDVLGPADRPIDIGLGCDLLVDQHGSTAQLETPLELNLRQREVCPHAQSGA